MVRYLLSRIGQTIVILFIVSIVVFFMMEAMPGDPVYARLGNDITEEEYEWAYHEYGYDQPARQRTGSRSISPATPSSAASA